MQTSLNTYTRNHAVLSVEPDDAEEFDVELFHTPCDWMDMHTEQIGDKLVVAYLVHDDSPPNPMTEWDGMGELITERCGVITDGSPAPHLGLEEMPYRCELTPDYELDGVYDLTKEKVTPILLDDEDFLEWCIDNYDNTSGCTDKRSFLLERLDDIDLGKYGTCIPGWLETIWERCQEQAWNELYEQGKIGTYLAIPVRYCDSNHGPGTASADTCSIEYANAVWIPKQCDLDNIIEPGLTYQELYKKADKYAQGCLDEYIKWCNGDCYGCVVEVFKRKEDGSWEQEKEEACWGFIGSEWAEEALKSDFFEPTVNSIKENNK